METTKENGGSFVDLNENEEERGGGGGGRGGKTAYIALKDHKLAGVSGGQEAGKGHIYVTGNGRNVNRDAPVQPSQREIMLDLVAAAEDYLPGQLTGVCGGDHGGLNGFTESFGEEEPAVVGEGGGLGVASCPAVLPGRVSGQSEGETPDSDDVTPVEEATDGRTSLPLERECPDMPNGDSPGFGCGSEAYCTHTGVFPSPLLLGQRLGLCDVDCKEVKVANGGLHIVTTARATCDWADLDYSPENNTYDLGATQENGSRSGFCSGALVPQCPGEDAPAAAELPHFLAPSLGSSAKPPSPNLNGDSPVSEPTIREDEEDFSDLSLPVRPQSLRTNLNLAVSLSCDATPLSPEDDGGFYFGDEGYEEDFRNVLEAGRRQSAPDKLPDLTHNTDSSDPKLMPKRFGIADFFTR